MLNRLFHRYELAGQASYLLRLRADLPSQSTTEGEGFNLLGRSEDTRVLKRFHPVTFLVLPTPRRTSVFFSHPHFASLVFFSIPPPLTHYHRDPVALPPFSVVRYQTEVLEPFPRQPFCGPPSGPVRV